MSSGAVAPTGSGNGKVSGDLSALGGTEVRFEFAMKDADLFAIELVCAPDE